MTFTHHYGDTAKEKSNELLRHMLIALVLVSVLIAITLGFRNRRLSLRRFRSHFGSSVILFGVR